MNRLLALLGLVRRRDVDRVLEVLSGEAKQQNRNIADAKKKLEAEIPTESSTYESAQQEIHNYTGRVFGVEVSIAVLRDLLSGRR